VKVLLDTHVVVWATHQSARLGAARQLILDADQRLLSAVCVWELAIKQRLGKLSIGSDVRAWTRRVAIELVLDHLPVTADHAAAVEDLPDLHRDPFDRLLVAQAVAEGAVLLTADERLTAYGDAVRLIGGADPGATGR
jgi:PIN domain nuclease of toxin-antitoxin system